MTLLLVFGLRYTPALLINSLIHIFVTQRLLPYTSFVIFNALTTFCYAGACWLLLYVFRINPRLRRLRDVVVLVVIGSIVTPLIVSIGQIANFTWFGIVPFENSLLLVLQYWAGDATGIAMLTPFLLVVLRRWPKLWLHTEQAGNLPTYSDSFSWLQRRSLLLLATELAIAGLCLWIAYGIPRATTLDYTYFIFLPLVWFAVRYGLNGAVAAVLVSNIVAVLLVEAEAAGKNALALQFGLMIASQLGILLGAAVTERQRKQAERRMLDQALAVAQRQESVARLARGVAHDFNNMLTVLRGNLDMALLDLQPGHPAHESVMAASQATEHASDLTRQLLLYSGQNRGDRLLVDCAALIQQMRELFRSSVDRSILFDYQLPVELPAIRAVPAEIRQVLLNLVVNASQAIMPNQGTITIAADVQQLDLARTTTNTGNLLQPGSYVQITVCDTGIGMDARTLASIFEPFFTTKEQGHGLGMGIVQGIVHSHGGDIVVESTPGSGTTIRLLLPVAPPE